jgi:hypothetical protein
VVVGTHGVGADGVLGLWVRRGSITRGAAARGRSLGEVALLKVPTGYVGQSRLLRVAGTLRLRLGRGSVWRVWRRAGAYGGRLAPVRSLGAVGGGLVVVTRAM